MLAAHIQQLLDRVRGATGQVMPVGGGTKPALSACGGQSVDLLDMTVLAGVTAYEPTEFLITAAAGTRLVDLQRLLEENGQYLPFDPLFADEGATLGGTVAGGISGPGSMLYGTLRDFIMEVEFIDGLGRLVRGGGKVVKNAAGFDLPKLLVGSYGRLGVLTEVTLKVFPAPPASATIVADFPTLAQAVAASQRLLRQPLPVAACDLDPNGRLSVRLSGPADSLDGLMSTAERPLANRVVERLPAGPAESRRWADRLARLAVGSETQACLVRAVTTPAQLLAWADDALAAGEGVEVVSCCNAGTVLWLRAADPEGLAQLDSGLQALQIPALVVQGPVDALTTLGCQDWLDAARSIQFAIDPDKRFVGL